MIQCRSLFIRTVAVLLLISVFVTACGNQLWGSYDPLLTATPAVFWTLAPTATLPSPTATQPPATETPLAPTETSTPPGPTPTPRPPILYYSQSGDSLDVVARHFGVEVGEITSANPLPQTGLLNPDTPLVIPNRLGETTPGERTIPDSEVVFSPSAVNFNIPAFVADQGGYLTDYRQYLGRSGWNSGAELIQRAATDNSINPRLLLALIEYQSGWVRGQPSNLSVTDYPLGYVDLQYRGLLRQMVQAIQDLSIGYYGWRGGTLTEVTFLDGTTLRISPNLNAGTVAIQYYFARHYSYDDWVRIINPQVGFPALSAELFGDPWVRAQTVEPLFPPGLTQPAMSLPFERGTAWSYSGGPHPAWDTEGPLAALDFAPPSVDSGCVPSSQWIVAVAPGLVVRSGLGVVILDTDGDGYEQTGWNLLYLHVSTDSRVPVGTWMDNNDWIGHPSCEGGTATGTHVHIARKYNGEWVLADGPLAFTLSGWVAHAGANPYQGTLTRDGEVVIARATGTHETRILRSVND